VTLSATRRFIRALREPPPADPQLQVPLLATILREARRRTDAQGASLVFVYLPRWERIHGDARAEFESMRSSVMDSVRAIGLPVLDLTEAFASAADPAALFARADIAVAHYSVAGYRLVAERIVSGLDSLAVARRPVQ
jgi:SGNH hydrolase-like domain, acetyltransferase AlgX